MSSAKAAGAAFVKMAEPAATEELGDVWDAVTGFVGGVAKKIKDAFTPDAKPMAAGTVAHKTPEQADALIRKHLSSEVTNAVDKGRQIAGKAQVVGDTEWDKAGIAHYGKKTWESQKKDRLNGFVDKKGRVWVHKDRGNPGTMVHEGVHKYSDDKLIKKSQPLNEGATEYFTRKVTAAEGIAPARRNYQRNYKTTKKLADVVGEDKLSSAYFDGDVDGLAKALDKKKGAGTWKEFTALTKENKWSEAGKLLD